jgi:DNA-binding response OmpR family regulator
MKGRIFLIHWNPLEAQQHAFDLRSEGWDVDVESIDGARAGRKILTNTPDAVVIYLSRLPSHGRSTAHALRTRKMGRHIPIVFVDGKEEAVELTREKVPDGVYTESDELSTVLGGFLKSDDRI